VVLSVDVNATGNPDTAAGFAAYVLSDNTLTVGPYTVDINPASGASLTEVHNAAPVNGGALTLGALYRDCVSTGDNTTNFYRVGLDAVIGGLTAGKQYTLTVWSYDNASTGARTSDWSIVGLGGPRFVANNYQFDGATLPTSDTANRFTVTAYADTNGTLTLRGRPSAAAATAQVFLNGFTVDELAAGAATPAVVLAVDFNDRSATGAANTQSGFSEFLLNGAEGSTQTTTARTFGSQTVTLTQAGGSTLDDRARVLNNSGAFTEGLVLKDFVFSSASSVGQGIDCLVQGLTPGATYLLELWSYDPGSSGSVRTSDWTVNGNTLWDDWGFNGANTPTLNTDYKMVGTFAANASGEFLISGRFVVNNPSIFLNALRISTLAPPQIVDLGRPIISEFMAENSSGITDEDGDTSDWIEIWNTTASTLNLAGWHLTDNPLSHTEWTFPAGVTIPSQGFLRVWASGKDRVANPANLHTNFALNKEAGGYLALYQPDGTTAATIYTNIPGQRANLSYGLFGTADPLTAGYFSPSTPLAQNTVAPVPGFVQDTTFDIKRGFFTSAQLVHISCTTVGATIYYTTDGSEPTTSSTVVPAGGINVTTTTVLRAKAFLAPLQPSNTDTQTYIFNAQVQNQPAAPAGWPTTWGYNSEVDGQDGAGNGIVPADYEMDPNVVGTTLPGYGITEALASLPALSIVMAPADFHSTGAGIYANPQSVGDAWERACSFEWLQADGESVHTNCGIRVHGNSSRRPYRMQKHSFRIAFRSSYGDGKLNFKLYDDTTVKTFNKLVLHAFFTDGWGLVSWDANRYRPETALSFRDRFIKEGYRAMGGPTESGRHAHLYINGLYWGVYEVGERMDEEWASLHLGGLPTEWDVIAPGETVYVRAGTGTAWDSLFTFINANDPSLQANYTNLAAQLDLANFADYYLLHVHGDSEDWPHHNGYAIRQFSAGADTRFKFITWDQEISFDPLVLVDRMTNSGNNNVDKTPGRLLQRLRLSAEFRLLFADRAHKHLHNGGALSLAVEQARIQSIADKLDKAIVAESARWGDTADATPYGNTVLPANATLKRETHWLQQIAAVKNTHLPNLHNNSFSYATITELRAQSLYPTTEPPNFSQFGGNVPANFSLTMTAPTGGSTIYYTLNGTDPRTPYTGVPQGTIYTIPVTLTQTGVVKARARNNTTQEWSALTEATFIVGTAASAANLAVTELNYNPQVGDEEFIELTNFSGQTIDLTGVHFEGITFTFANGTLLTAGQSIVVVRNSAVFTARYGGAVNVAGIYTGALDNTGEEIAVIAANGTDIERFTYNDKAPWPNAPDGGGRSLVRRSPTLAPGIAANWRSSAANGGNPGTTDTVIFSGPPLADADHDDLRALLEYAQGGSDNAANDIPPPIVAFQTMDVGSGPQSFLILTARVAPAADSAVLTAEFASDLNAPAWDAAVYLGETLALDGTITRKWRAPQPYTGVRQFMRLKASM
jgi:hypothetical protein